MSSITEWMDANIYSQYTDKWDNKRYRVYILSFLEPSMSILDVGAGRGYVKEMNFKGEVEFVAGVDPDPVVLENSFLDEAKVISSDGKIPYPTGTFDLVFTNNVLEHVENPIIFFLEVYRVLKPGGVFLSKTTNKLHYVSFFARITPHSFHEYINEKRGRKTRDTYPTYHRCNSIGDITKYADQTDFTIMDLQLWEGRPEYLRFSALAYFCGYLYERLVNQVSFLSKFRCVLVFCLKK